MSSSSTRLGSSNVYVAVPSGVDEIPLAAIEIVLASLFDAVEAITCSTLVLNLSKLTESNTLEWAM